MYVKEQYWVKPHEDLSKYEKEAERVEATLYELYKDVGESTIHVDITQNPQFLNSNIPVLSSKYPTYHYTIIDGSAVDVQIDFGQFTYKFLMKWGQENKSNSAWNRGMEDENND